MYFERTYSDQFDNWSDKGGKHDGSQEQVHRCIEAQTHIAAEAVSTPRCDSPRFADRTVQAMRQAWVSMCSGPGPRPQVLSIGYASGVPPADGVRSAGVSTAGHRTARELQAAARDTRRDLCHQHRIASSQRTALTHTDGHRSGHSNGRSLCREHAARIIARAGIGRGENGR